MDFVPNRPECEKHIFQNVINELRECNILPIKHMYNRIFILNYNI